jgi:hypothetical protein
VPFLHYYSMGKSDNIHAIAKEVFWLNRVPSIQL